MAEKTETPKVETSEMAKYIEVESAVSLSEKQLDALRKKLVHILKNDNFVLQVKVNTSLLGGLTLNVDSLLIDASVKGQLALFQKEIENKVAQAVDVNKISSIFSQTVDEFKEKTEIKEVGKVLSVSDGVARVEGLKTIAAGERVVFEGGQYGMALNLNPDVVDIVIFDNAQNIKEGALVTRTGQMNTVPVGMELLGRVLNPLG